MTKKSRLVGILIALALGLAVGSQAKDKTVGAKPWCALHLLHFQSDADLLILEKQLPALAERGVNVLIFEVDYGFSFRSHPELRASEKAITVKGARQLTKACRRLGIRLIPQFQSLGHQSWAGETYALLTRYPELDLTPGAFPGNQGIYCREWDPMNPRVNQIVFALLDEIIDAFDADALHVGMDEVFLIGDIASPSTRRQDPAVVYAKAVNDLHSHIVGKRHRTMLMWADRFIDDAKVGHGAWESSRNGMAAAIDLVPKDIVMCDWHYEVRPSYDSVPMFLEKGFSVLPTSWRNVTASRALITQTLALQNPRMLGHLFSMWSGQLEGLADWPPLVDGAPLLRAQSQARR
jgi:hypothetical protein